MRKRVNIFFALALIITLVLSVFIIAQSTNDERTEEPNRGMKCPRCVEGYLNISYLSAWYKSQTFPGTRVHNGVTESWIGQNQDYGKSCDNTSVCHYIRKDGFNYRELWECKH